MKPARRVCLVRRLVFGEPDVAVDAEHRPLGVAADLGRERLESRVHLPDEVAHWLAHLRLVVRAMRLEPFLVVVPRESAKEPQRGRGERHPFLQWVHRSRETCRIYGKQTILPETADAAVGTSRKVRSGRKMDAPRSSLAEGAPWSFC